MLEICSTNSGIMKFLGRIYFHPKHECFAVWGEGTLEDCTVPQNSEILRVILGQPQERAGLSIFALFVTNLF